MERGLGAGEQTELEGGLRELVLRWFTETQEETLIQHNGDFPPWFRGFMARKDAEDLLSDKTMGCFLIRLSDRVLGYILSYKGPDGCRHFVINQNDGLFVLEGYHNSHHSLTELIEHYKCRPIQLYGEYLTSCYSESNPSELYDVVAFESQEKSGVSVQVLKTLWDQKSDGSCRKNNDGKITQKPQQKNILPNVQPPALPSKTNTRKLSVDLVSPSQEVPPVPKRGSPLSYSPSQTPTDTLYSQINRGERPRATMPLQPSKVHNGMGSKRGNPFSSYNTDRSSNGDLTHNTNHEYSSVGNRSTSLPKLDRGTGEETPIETQLTSNSQKPLKKFTCHTYSLHSPRVAVEQQSKVDHHDILKLNPLYQACEWVDETPAWHKVNLYTEVPEGDFLPTHGSNENPYELIEASPGIKGNHDETLEDKTNRNSKPTVGKTNIKWPKFLSEYKKK